MDRQSEARLVKAHALRSRFAHLVPDGGMVTLCGEIAQYPIRRDLQRDTCTTCRGIARRTDREIPC